VLTLTARFLGRSPRDRERLPREQVYSQTTNA